MNSVIEKFLKYVSYDTNSNSSSEKSPSTEGQLVLAKILKEELITLGLSDVTMDEYGYVMGTLPSNTENCHKSLGLVAHMDTSQDAIGKNIKPKIIENYDGEDIALNKDVILSKKLFPELKNYIGNDLIVTD